PSLPPAPPTTHRESPFQPGWLVEHLHDSEFSTIVESAPNNAGFVELFVISSRRCLFEQAVHEKNTAVRLQRRPDFRPERIKEARRNVRQPEAKEDGIESPG